MNSKITRFCKNKTIKKDVKIWNFFYFRDKPNKDFTNEIKTDFNLEDLNFDPTAIIGDNNGDWNVSWKCCKKYFLKFISFSWIIWIRMISWPSWMDLESWPHLPHLELGLTMGSKDQETPLRMIFSPSLIKHDCLNQYSRCLICFFSLIITSISFNIKWNSFTTKSFRKLPSM